MRLRLSLPLWPLLAAVLALTALAYLPGLHGGFLFDDFANLPALGATGPVDTWPTFWRYLTSGTADPTGRPLTLLSFVLDARDWPADPFPFKRTNLILHLCNGVLLYALLARLGQALRLPASRTRWAALLGTAFWLLHPLLVSTTLYIVQREAMLPATFVLAGLLAWLHGRAQLMQGKTRAGLAWSVLGLGGCTVLGVLSKANGALLPVYALLIDRILAVQADTPQRPDSPDAAWWQRRVMWLFAWLPSAALGVYLIWVGATGIVHGGPDGRPWTYAERLLTEPRVLIDYLALLWLPHAASTGLFNDQYIASTSLFHPISTLPALLAVLGMIVGAWRMRRARPALALAVLFYFAGQLLESTSIPLELYFEHRNYVPSMLLFWPLALWLGETRQLRAFKLVLAVGLLSMLALLTHARATVWGDVSMQAEIWAKLNPTSPRAQANAAQIEIRDGRTRAAIARLEPLLAAHPEQLQLALNLIGARCASSGVTPADIAAARRAMRLAPNTGSLLTHWFERTLPSVQAGRCPGLDVATLQTLVNAGLENPKMSWGGPRQDLLYMRARIALVQQRPEDAEADLVLALEQRVRPGFALQAAALLGSSGHPTQGLRLLDRYQQLKAGIHPGIGMPMLHQWVLDRQHYWPNEFAYVRHQLTLDAARANTNTVRSAPAKVVSH